MSVIIVGHRRYGRVRTHASEYAQTSFVHLAYVPLWPTGSVWVIDTPGAVRSFPIRLHRRSVAAAYLRTWVAALAAMFAIAPSWITTGIAIGLAALYGWSWTWR